MLTTWNEGYDRLLTDIDYRFDQPIFFQAGVSGNVKPISTARTNTVNCTKSVTEQAENIGYDPRSLKVQFAMIAACYGKVNASFGDMRSESLADEKILIADKTADIINAALDDVA